MYEVGWLLCKEPKFAFSYVLWYIHVHILPDLTFAKYKCVCVFLLPTIASIELAERQKKNSVNLTFVTKTSRQYFGQRSLVKAKHSVW